MMQIQLTISLSDEQEAAFGKLSTDEIRSQFLLILNGEIAKRVDFHHAVWRAYARQADFPDQDLHEGDWKCDSGLSPDGWCWYDHEVDPCHDDCLFCHEPEERK